MNGLIGESPHCNNSQVNLISCQDGAFLGISHSRRNTAETNSSGIVNEIVYCSMVKSHSAWTLIGLERFTAVYQGERAKRYVAYRTTNL